MKPTHKCLILVIALMLSSIIQQTSAEPLYNDEYKFLLSKDEWMQIEGYDNNSYSYDVQSILQVINSTNENITYSELTISGLRIMVYNYSLTDSLSWIGPIGFDFINPNQMAYYYDLWLNQENLTEAYFSVIGVGYTTDERLAGNHIFKANLSIYLENQKVDFIYDNKEEEFQYIFDSYTLDLQICVEYDSAGVLLKWKEDINIEGSLIQYTRFTLKERVDEFNKLEETTDETNVANLLYALISLIALVKILKKNKNKSIHR